MRAPAGAGESRLRVYGRVVRSGVESTAQTGWMTWPAASITRQTNAVAVVVSESSIVRVFDNGELISEIIPEIWMMSRHSLHVSGPVRERAEQQIRVVTKEE